MNVLSKEQLKEIAKIIEDHMGVLVYVTTGQGEKIDPNLLHKLGLPLDAPSMIDNAFVLGKIVQMLQENDISKMTFEELKQKAKEYRLSVVERNSLEYAKRQAAQYVTALGQKIERDINSNIDKISYDATLEAVERNIIRDTVAQAILKQQKRAQLASELGRALDDWKRDWQRVAHTELWNAKLQGEVLTILQGESIYSDSRGDTLVFRRPAPDACKHCKRLYLEDDGVTPKVFKLKDLIANGTNVGRKASEWLPTTGTTHPNCFVSGKVKVLTVSGYKPIKDIKVGDFVLTHKGRFRAVTNTLEHYTKRYKGEVIRIRYSNMKGKSKTLEVTPDHKFLTQRGWVRADELTTNDTLKLLVVECESCGKLVSYVSGSTLCYRCQANKQWEERRKNPELFEDFRTKVSKTIKKLQEDPRNRVKHTEEFKQKMRKMLLKSNPMKNPEILKKKVETERKRGHYERYRQRMLSGGAIKAMDSVKTVSRPQKELFFMVKSLFPEAVLEYPLQVAEDKWFSLDIAIVEEKINIEFDGSYWHKNEEADKQRDLLLAKNGWTVIRYCDEVPSMETLKADLERVMKNHTGSYKFIDHPIEEITKTQVYSKKLYDITVDEDHSFIVEGIVSHNCTCPIAVLPEGFGFDDQGNLVYVGIKGEDDK